MENVPQKPTKRNVEITRDYLNFLDKHLADIIEEKAEEMLELRDIANALSISHTHLAYTIQQTMGNHPCYYYDLKIIELSKEMLLYTGLPVAEIARKLTYDPSNFSKFFKKFTGLTPGNFRKEQKKF